MKPVLKQCADGFLLAWQFYTTVPIKKQIPIDERRLKYAFYTIPFIGIVIGLMNVGMLILHEKFLHLPLTVLALFILTLPIIITGGIHLEGWMDMSDAYFSYRDKQKRLEIMSDPHTGSYAVLSVIFLLAWRYVFILDILQSITLTTCLLIISMYYFARMSMCIVFIQGKLAKQDGLAAFFKQGIHRNDIYFFCIRMFMFLLLIACVDLLAVRSVFPVLFVSVVLAIAALRWINKQFGGLTGDTLGAVLEGGETVLWFIVWLLHSFATGLQ